MDNVSLRLKEIYCAFPSLCAFSLFRVSQPLYSASYVRAACCQGGNPYFSLFLLYDSDLPPQIAWSLLHHLSLAKLHSVQVNSASQQD
jgi:hypothetical protein